jgi:hypothetical protein
VAVAVVERPVELGVGLEVPVLLLFVTPAISSILLVEQFPALVTM